MSPACTAHRQRAVMASGSKWERIGEPAAAPGMEKSRYVIQRALAPESLPPEVMLRAIRQGLVLAVVEEREIREAGAWDRWDAARHRQWVGFISPKAPRRYTTVWR